MNGYIMTKGYILVYEYNGHDAHFQLDVTVSRSDFINPGLGLKEL